MKAENLKYYQMWIASQSVSNELFTHIAQDMMDTIYEATVKGYEQSGKYNRNQLRHEKQKLKTKIESEFRNYAKLTSNIVKLHDDEKPMQEVIESLYEFLEDKFK